MTIARRPVTLTALSLLLVLACHRGVARNSPDFAYLTQEQMLERNFTTAYDAIAALRANWLVVRGPDSFQNPSEIWVYYDQNKLGGVQTLKGVTVNEVAYIRHYSAIDATTRWGVGHAAGVIFVSSRR